MLVLLDQLSLELEGKLDVLSAGGHRSGSHLVGEHSLIC